MRPIGFGWRDVPGIAFVALIVIGGLYLAFKYPDWRAPSGFGPEWQCSGAGRGGPGFCIKKPPAEAAKPE
jgi:hypothetical protein